MLLRKPLQSTCAMATIFMTDSKSDLCNYLAACLPASLIHHAKLSVFHQGIAKYRYKIVTMREGLWLFTPGS